MSQPNSGPGGYQKPANPAPVSGPGKLSRRTDGQPLQQLPDAAYGEQQTFRDVQSGAPMAGGSQAQPGAGGSLPFNPVDTSGATPIGADSQYPDEPITAGADQGPGPSSSAMGLGQLPPDPSMQYSKALLPTLELIAAMPSASQEFQQMVRRLRAS